MDYEITSSDRKFTNLLIKFFNKEDLDVGKTNETGEPVFKNVTYIEKIVVGDPTNRIIRPATFEDKRDFAEQYRRFLDSKPEEKRNGIDIDIWAPMEEVPQLKEKLSMNKILLVEELANMSDDQARNIDHLLLGFKYKAIDYLKSKESRFTSLENELKKKDDEIKELQEKLNCVISNLNKKSAESHHTTVRPNSEDNDGNISEHSSKSSGRSGSRQADISDFISE